MTINPLNLNGKDWPFLSTNVAITSRYAPDGTMDASVAARFVPTRLENGEVQMLEDQALTLYRGSLKELRDANEVAAMTSIKTALEVFIASKLSQ